MFFCFLHSLYYRLFSKTEFIKECLAAEMGQINAKYLFTFESYFPTDFIQPGQGADNAQVWYRWWCFFSMMCRRQDKGHASLWKFIEQLPQLTMNHHHESAMVKNVQSKRLGNGQSQWDIWKQLQVLKGFLGVLLILTFDFLIYSSGPECQTDEQWTETHVGVWDRRLQTTWGTNTLKMTDVMMIKLHETPQLKPFMVMSFLLW